MESPPGVLESLLKEREELLEELCRLFESALAAARGGDLEGAGAPAPRTETILAELLELDSRITQGEPSPRAVRLLERARGLHASLLSALEKEKEKTAEEIHSTRAFRRMLKSYRRPPHPTGRRLNTHI